MHRDCQGQAVWNYEGRPGTWEDFSNLFAGDPNYEFQFMPQGLMYKSYLAGEKESRFSSVWLSGRPVGPNSTSNSRVKWDNTLGLRIGIFRYGSTDMFHPEGFQLDAEGAALARLTPLPLSSPMEAMDYRFGFVGTWRRGGVAIKAGYSHLSSHLGDEFLLINPTFHRENYVRDSVVMGITYDLAADWQIYSEISDAVGAEAGAKPVELQYGIQYSPYGPSGMRGTPFMAINGHTRQEFHWTTSVNVEAGWQWRGKYSPHLWRAGVQYYNGPSSQWEFVGRHEQLVGAGLWFDY